MDKGLVFLIVVIGLSIGIGALVFTIDSKAELELDTFCQEQGWDESTGTWPETFCLRYVPDSSGLGHMEEYSGDITRDLEQWRETR